MSTPTIDLDIDWDLYLIPGETKALGQSLTPLSTIDLEKLKCLFTYMDSFVPYNCSKKDERRTEMVEYLDILQSFSYISGVYHQRHYMHIVKTGFYDIVPRLIHLLRECVVNHQWPQALQLVQNLINEHNDKVDSTICNVGLAALYQLPEGKTTLIDQFVKQVCQLKKVISVEVFLDYLTYFLSNGDLQEVKDLLQEMKRRSYYSTQIITEKRRQALTLFFAYQGLVLYVEWKLMILKEQDQDMDDVSQRMSQGYSTQVARTTADSAIEFLMKIKDQEGIWDVFITSLVEMYNYYDLDSREILEEYRRKNPNNPNAHRYMFDIVCQQAESLETQIECLKPLMQLDPSNPLALTMVKKMGSDSPEAVTVLFDYLDFDHCQNDVEAWKLLTDAVKLSSENTNILREIEVCWNLRKDWWPQVRFKNDEDITNKDLRKLKHKVKKRLEALG